MSAHVNAVTIYERKDMSGHCLIINYNISMHLEDINLLQYRCYMEQQNYVSFVVVAHAFWASLHKVVRHPALKMYFMHTRP